MEDGPNAEHCAGALIFLEAQEQPNQMMRIAERLGLYDRRKLDMESPVFDDADAMADHLRDQLGSTRDEPDWMRNARRFRAREIARIAARDLMDLSSVPETTGELSRLADTCLAPVS